VNAAGDRRKSVDGLSGSNVGGVSGVAHPSSASRSRPNDSGGVGICDSGLPPLLMGVNPWLAEGCLSPRLVYQQVSNGVDPVHECGLSEWVIVRLPGAQSAYCAQG
jgi:hypothetical protein